MNKEIWLPDHVLAEQKLKELAAGPDSAAAEEFLLKEYGIGTADLELAQDDVGWARLGISSQDGLAEMTRVNAVRRARAYFLRDPLSRQAVRIWTDYALGRGISWKAKEERANDVLRAFWDEKINQPVLSNQGQRKSSDMMLIDGEIFFIFFNDGAGGSKVRRIDPLEITEIITDPDDKDTKKLYKRDWATVTGQVHTAYYPDWANDDPKNTRYKSAYGGEVAADAESGVIYHVPFMSLGTRGVSLLLSAMDWAKAHRKFLEARAAIMQAMAIFAWKAKVKGGSAAVTALRSQLRSSLSAGGSSESSPPPAPGSTWVENESLDMQPVKTDSGAQAAQVDGAMLLQLFGSAVGVFPHYFGAGEAFRLATATAMERPMRVQFEAYQQLWGDIYDSIFNYVMENNGVPGDKRFVDIDFPPIVEKDATDSIKAIVEILTVMPELGVDEVKKLVLTNLGINNTDEVLAQIGPVESASNKLVRALKDVRTAILKEDGNGRNSEGTGGLLNLS